TLRGRNAVDVDAGLRAPRRSHADGPLRADARGSNGGIHEELAAGVEAEDWGRSNQHPALLELQDCTLVTGYRSIYAPRTGGAYDSHHRTAGIVGRTRQRGSVAARGARAAVREGADHRITRGRGFGLGSMFAEKVSLAVSREKDGKLRLVYLQSVSL